MNHLTNTHKSGDNIPTTNALVVGFSNLNGQNNGATAPSNSLGVFLCLKGFPLVVCGGKPKGLPVIAVGVRRVANSSYAATIIFSKMWCQLVLNQTQDTNMTNTVKVYLPEDAFVLSQIVDKSSLQDAVYTSLNRAQALLKLIQNEGADLEAGFSLPQSVILHALDGAEADIKQCLTLMDHWLSDAPAAEVGESH